MCARKFIGALHRWLGLISGAVVFTVSTTGCIYVFADEIKRVVYRSRLEVHQPGSIRLPVDRLLQAAQDTLGPAYPITRLELFPQPERSCIFRAMKTNAGGLTHWSYIEYYYRVYVDPYTAEVLRVENSKFEFFQLVVALHTRLLFGGRIGHAVVGYSVLIFVVLLVTGLVLWWPGNRAAARQRFAFRWKPHTGRKRKNYDLHLVPGFYCLFPLLVVAVTGLVWSFEWIDKSLQFLANGGAPQVVSVVPAARLPSPDSVSRTGRQQNSEISFILPALPGTADHIAPLPNGFVPLASASVDSPRIQGRATVSRLPGSLSPGDLRCSQDSLLVLEDILASASLSQPSQTMYLFNFPSGQGDRVQVSAILQDGTRYKRTVGDYERSSGRLLQEKPYTALSRGERLRGMNYDLHTGSILGLPGKCLAFAASLVAASLPVTGFYIWWYRRAKKGKRRRCPA